jgi:protease I
MSALKGKKVAIVVTDGFEESEFTQPKEALEKAGAEAVVISLKAGKIKAWAKTDWGGSYAVDKTIDQVNADDYDGLVLPGGVMNPDKLRMNSEVVKFTASFMEEGKPVAAICHGPWTLVETGLLHGRTVTSYPSIKTDLVNAGANWVDREVVVDKGLVTSRNPGDLPAFCKKMVEEIAEGRHQVQQA